MTHCQVNTCCIKCFCGGMKCGQNDQHCGNIYCSCHQPPTEEKLACGHTESTHEEVGCGNVVPKDSLEWEEELNSRFYGGVPNEEMGSNQINETELITFIKEQTAKAKEEERAWIRGVIEQKKVILWNDDAAKHLKNISRNETITDILKKIGE